MKKFKVRVAQLGPNSKLRQEIGSLRRIRSSILEFEAAIEEYSLRGSPDLDGWMYSTQQLANISPSADDEDILLIITTVPLERDYIALRLGQGRVIFTAHVTASILAIDGIPFRNLIVRYAYAFLMLKLCGDSDLSQGFDWEEYAHADTRGCLFDMTPLKYDLSQSCDKPIICRECEAKILSKGVSRNKIDCVRGEIKKNVRAPAYWRFSRFVKSRPFVSLAIASIWALTLGTLSSLIASFLTAP